MTEPTHEPFQVKGFGAFIFTILVLTACVDAVNWVAGAIVS